MRIALIRLRDSLGDSAPQSLLDAIHTIECRICAPSAMPLHDRPGCARS